MTPIEYKSFVLPDYDKAEIMRYAKTKSTDGLPFEECLDELRYIDGKVAFAEFPLTILPDSLDLGFAKTGSKDLRKCLGEAEKILLFAATIGILPDKLTAKYSHLSPVKAVLTHAIATERIEALCDAFCLERKQYYENQGYILKPRFSPGYGDLPLSLQKDIISTLNCNRLLGISLTESLLMMPSKSVTAIVGICRK